MPLTRVVLNDPIAVANVNQLIDLLTGVMSDQAVTILNDFVAKSVRASGVTGLANARSTGRYIGQWTSSGAPTGLTAQVGDWGFDSNFTIWACTGITPATWAVVSVRPTGQSTPGNPTGVLNTTALMLGLAVSFTPTHTGKLLVAVTGDGFATGGATFGGNIQIRYGTGTAPTNGAAVAGTAAGAAIQYRGTATSKSPFSLQAIITGLTLTTAYWFDLSLAAAAATNTASLENLAVNVVEL